MDEDTNEALESHDEDEHPTEDVLWITIGVRPEGFSLNVDEAINPITLAGVGWYLTQLAEIAVGNQMMLRAQQEADSQKNAPALLVPKGHLAKGGKQRMD